MWCWLLHAFWHTCVYTCSRASQKWAATAKSACWCLLPYTLCYCVWWTSPGWVLTQRCSNSWQGRLGFRRCGWREWCMSMVRVHGVYVSQCVCQLSWPTSTPFYITCLLKSVLTAQKKNNGPPRRPSCMSTPILSAHALLCSHGTISWWWQDAGIDYNMALQKYVKQTRKQMHT